MSPIQSTYCPKTGKKEDPAHKSPLKSPLEAHTLCSRNSVSEGSASCYLPPTSGGRAAERPPDHLLDGPEPPDPLLRPSEGLPLRTLTSRLACRETCS